MSFEIDLNHEIGKLEVFKNSGVANSIILGQIERIKQLENLVAIEKDYANNPLTKAPLFEEPKQYDIGFIPTISELDMAFQQMPVNWPGDTYTHELKVVKDLKKAYYKTEEVLIGKLTFTKLDGQWVYFGPTKYK